MSIFEYNQERHMMQEREAAWNEGHAAGEKEGRAAGEKIGREAGRQEGLQSGLQQGIREIVRNMIRQGLSDEQIRSYCNITSEDLKKYKSQD